MDLKEQMEKLEELRTAMQRGGPTVALETIIRMAVVQKQIDESGGKDE